MATIHEANRRVLGAVRSWISDEVWQTSVYGYGIPPEARVLVDQCIGAEFTYSDAMISLASKLQQPIRYVEFGVSVGKNFLQVASGLRGVSLVGFDIEEINPVLAEYFEVVGRREWATTPLSMKKTASSLTTLRQPGTSNQVEYLCGDIFDPRSWAQLAGRQFNLVFSDAFHSPDALQMECAMLLEHELLDSDEVVILWDDLAGPMEEAFRDVCGRLQRHRRHCVTRSFITPLRGWLGENEGHHSVGILTSFRKWR